jgi:hypothetical protein
MKQWITWAIMIAMSSVGLAAPPADESWIAGLVGGWAGEDNQTPMGRMGFAMLFERQQDGSLYSRSAVNRETFIDLQFSRADDGRWLLTETGGLENLGVQSHTLIPVEAPGELRRWVLEERPDYLVIDIASSAERLHLAVQLRGESHVQFDLERLPEEALPELRESMAAAALRSPERDSIHDHSNDKRVPVAILDARSNVAASPDSGSAHLQLAQALGAEIEGDPMSAGALYAGEMLDSLKTALELDPRLVEAYHWLAGYYMNAPSIAGGSLDEAEAIAQRLAAVDKDAGTALLAQVEARREPIPAK